jgi:hypothetical protein
MELKERVYRIADGILTAIPILGTAYNGATLLYIQLQDKPIKT